MTKTDTGSKMTKNVSLNDGASLVRELQAFIRLVLKRFGRDQCMRIAAALSYTSLLALVPLGAIAFAILKAFPVFDNIEEQIKSLLFENFLPESVDGAQTYFDQFIGQTEGLTAIGIVVLAVTAIMLLWTIEGALNSIFHVKATRPFVPRLMMFWAVITLGPILLGGRLSLATYFYALSPWAGAEKIPGLGGVVYAVAAGVVGDNRLHCALRDRGLSPGEDVARTDRRHLGGIAVWFVAPLVRPLHRGLSVLSHHLRRACHGADFLDLDVSQLGDDFARC